jgi:hypothetical protein
MTVGPAPSADALLRGQIADPDCTWSLGGYGAAATFARDPGEPAEFLEGAAFGLVTARGALVLTAPPTLRPFAYETGFVGGWSQAVALCLPASGCAMGRRSVLTELGPDDAAVRPQDRAALLFDLGLGLEAADACVRTADPDLIGRIRAARGRSILDAGHPALAALSETGLHTVFMTRAGRVEVYESGAGTGPRIQILPKLVRLRRRHAATAPIPAGLVPCGEFRPAHPAYAPPGRPIRLDPARHAAFGRLLDAWGDPTLVAVRRAVLAGQEPDPDQDSGRFVRSAIRAARAQVAAMRS